MNADKQAIKCLRPYDGVGFDMFEFYQAPVWRFTKARIGQDHKANKHQRQPKAHAYAGVNQVTKEGKIK